MVLQQRSKFFGCNTCLAKDGTEGPTIKRLVVGNDNLSERLIASKDDVASILTPEFKSFLLECGNALAP
jgi:hypothetical protein